jgi:hypothetical protein
MAEEGKCLIARGIARTVEQYLRLTDSNIDLKLIAWGTEARYVEWNRNDEFPPEMLDCKGAVNVESLITLLGKQPDGKVLFITDGFWPVNDAKILKRWKNELLPETLHVIKAGADSNPQLKGTDVFSAEDLFAALDGWLERGAV